MGFNEAQTQAIQHTDGPCLVLAGPGSGKTLTIVNRVKYLIEKQKVRPEEILVVTFTRFAAAEMKSRLCLVMGKRDLPVTVGTFHGIYYGILKWAYRMNQENILSETEKYQILRGVINKERMEIFDEEDFIQDIAAEIGKVKNNRIPLEEFVSEKCSADAFRNIYRNYEQHRKELKKIDFDDMLVLCYELFRSRPDVLAQWQKKFRYVLIDEFQDINRIQYDVIRMLAQPENNLFVVGDDDQAIYGFRGADSELMLGFGKDFPNAKQILLGMNYRSTANIVQNSLKLIENNVERYSKKLEANREGGSCLHIQEVKDPVEEAEYVLEEIQKCKENGIKEEEIAILFRVHTDARAVVEAMVERKIPFQMKEHLPNIYEHFIAKDIMAYFRLATGKRRRQDFLQVMNRPKRYLGRDSVSGSQVSFEDMRKFYCDKDWMIDRIDQFEWDVKMLMKMAPYAAIQYIRKRIGYDDFLKEYAFTHQINRSDLNEVLAEIEEAAKAFSSVEEWFAHVEEYTETLKVKEKERNRPRPGVRLMTIHASKGLEFKQVFLIAANEGRIPYQKAKTDKEIEEERRLFYVAMTRAKDFLKICYVKIKNGKEVTPSRFVDELLKS
ncbi:ATP-dependent helicase [Ruminococcus sp. AM27-11LB]|jgi:DNA helicase-2/ATP-dependent DNA helicase PcrA|uniref:ATP-dependent helicase n=1 Tax=Mediterraneibacter TaxID=2316020 RepID=UPI000E4AB85F|nr:MULTISPECIES: ATP-dependent helicase [Mediterraneibacter]RGH93436.1 ATP-dependent helicase [Ruminococcus sp. AM27-27]RGH97348.1 ATP-dependent helicase [Ruminococcus sp. AM27-11LB]